jgi:hypothetical protein
LDAVKCEESAEGFRPSLVKPERSEQVGHARAFGKELQGTIGAGSIAQVAERATTSFAFDI